MQYQPALGSDVLVFSVQKNQFCFPFVSESASADLISDQYIVDSFAMAMGHSHRQIGHSDISVRLGSL